MTAQPARHGPLTLVSRSDNVVEAPHRRPERILRQWDPEAQLVGALMHLPAQTVAPVLQLVPDSVIWMPRNRWAFEIIRHLAAQDIAPDPVTVLHAARSKGPSDSGGARVTPRRHHTFALHLADLYTQTLTPALVRQYAHEVLENAFRRAAAAHGAQLAELAQNGSSRAELAQHVAAMRSELAELWRRAETAWPAVCNP